MRPEAHAAHAVALAIVAATITSAGDALACGSGRPFVAAETDSLATAADPVLVVQHLRAELAARALEVCAPDSGANPVARIRLTAVGAGSAVVIDVDDLATEKRLQRTLPLGSVPTAGRPVVVAMATHQLLRASWAEPATETEAPAVAVAAPAPPAPAFAASFAIASELFAGGALQAGPELAVTAAITPRAALRVAAGVRWSRPEVAPDGRASIGTVQAGLALPVTVTRPGAPWGFALVPRADVGWATAEGAPSPGASGDAGSAAVLHVALALELRRSFAARSFVNATAGAGHAVRGIEATDARRRVTATTGAIVTLGAGAGVRF